MTSRDAWLAAAAVAVLAALPFVLSSYYLALATKMLIIAVFAMSLDVLLGYTGLPSLGHAAFFGVAGYAAGLLTVRAGWNAWAAFPAALAAGAAMGALFGLLAVRALGSYFLMITLALAQVLWGLAFGWRSLTGGDDGLSNVPKPALPMPFYYFVLVAVVLATVLLVCIVRSPFGHALRGIRESESRMRALGYNIWLYKYLAFVIAATFAGVAGALYAFYNGFVGLEYLNVVRSAEVLLMVILGGAGTLIGPALGAGLIVLLENVISGYTQRWLLVLGTIYVVVTLFAPKGLVGLVHDLRRKR